MKGFKRFIITTFILIAGFSCFSCGGDKRQLKNVSEEDLKLINLAESFIMDDERLGIHNTSIKDAFDSSKVIKSVRYKVDRLNNGMERVNFIVNVDPKLFVESSGDQKKFINDYVKYWYDEPIDEIVNPNVEEFGLMWSVYVEEGGEKEWYVSKQGIENTLLCTMGAIVLKDNDGKKITVIGKIPSGGTIFTRNLNYGEAKVLFDKAYDEFISIWH